MGEQFQLIVEGQAHENKKKTVPEMSVFKPILNIDEMQRYELHMVGIVSNVILHRWASSLAEHKMTVHIL